VARSIMGTPQYRQSRCERKKVEVLFAHLKRVLKLDRLRLRGPSGAHDEFLLAATARNLRRLAKRLCPGGSNAACAASYIKSDRRIKCTVRANAILLSDYFKCKGLPRPEAACRIREKRTCNVRNKWQALSCR
jgi:hypothetical protein